VVEKVVNDVVQEAEKNPAPVEETAPVPVEENAPAPVEETAKEPQPALLASSSPGDPNSRVINLLSRPFKLKRTQSVGLDT
jgi:hypothetical protein